VNNPECPLAWNSRLLATSYVEVVMTYRIKAVEMWRSP